MISAFNGFSLAQTISDANRRFFQTRSPMSDAQDFNASLRGSGRKVEPTEDGGGGGSATPTLPMALRGKPSTDWADRQKLPQAAAGSTMAGSKGLGGVTKIGTGGFSGMQGKAMVNARVPQPEQTANSGALSPDYSQFDPQKRRRFYDSMQG